MSTSRALIGTPFRKDSGVNQRTTRFACAIGCSLDQDALASVTSFELDARDPAEIDRKIAIEGDGPIEARAGVARQRPAQRIPRKEEQRAAPALPAPHRRRCHTELLDLPPERPWDAQSLDQYPGDGQVQG